MVFAALPPEVNSGLMYSGPGSGPLLTAAAAWDGVAADLHTAAAGYRTVVADLTAQSWHGPSATAMAAAVSPYLSWLTTTAVRAEKIAAQAKWTAAAYESAFFMTVPPAAVAENRARLLSLVATNFLGQNTPAIAATEVHYGEMWAQDVAAMNGYAAAATTAIEARSFDPPPQTTDPAGSLGQAGAVEQAVGSSAGSNAQTASSQLTSALQGLAPAVDGMPPTVPPVPEPMGVFDLLAIVADEVGIGAALPLSIVSIFLGGAAWYYAELDSREIIESQDLLSGGQSTILDAIEELGAAWLTGGSPASAGLGQALSAGNLSVPPSWATAAPEIRTAAYTAPEPAGAVGLAGLGTAFGQMALAGMAGSAVAGAVGRPRSDSAGPAAAEQPRPQSPQPQSSQPQQPQRPAEPAEAPQRRPAVSVAELAADLRELGELRDSGLLTESEFSEQKQRLLGR